MSEVLALGISHKTAPLELRERIAFTEGRATGILRELGEEAEVHEAATISTCNRTELYLFTRVAGAEPARARGRDAADRAGRPPLLPPRG
jgi:glutamyl-tRNA reductase